MARLVRFLCTEGDWITGSQLNMLSSQDTRLEMLRQVENDRNGIVEAQQTMGSAWASCLDIGRKYSGIVAGCMNTIGNLGGAVAGFATGLILDLHTSAARLQDGRLSYAELAERFGPQRVFDTPLSEEGMTGVAIGAALAGMRPILTHIRMDFMLLAMNQIVKNKTGHLCSECPLAGAHLVQGIGGIEAEGKPSSSSHPIEILAKAYGL